MPEFPDVEVYREVLERRIAGQRLAHVDLLNPFLLRTAVPSLDAAFGKRVRSVRRLGKRLVDLAEAEAREAVDYFISSRR